MDNKTYYLHYIHGTNPFALDDEWIIKLDEPRLYVRYNVEEGYFASYEMFVNAIADIQWLDGVNPDVVERDRILTDMWNFLCHCERQWEQDMEDYDDLEL